MNADRFHEWPLVVFTTLAVMGAGLLTAPLIAAIVGPSAAAASPVVLAGTALLAAGLLVSLAHLGQPQRSPMALARVGRSRLSNEVLLASATLAAGIVAVVLPYVSPVTTLLPSFCAVAFLVSLGRVYALSGQ
jgi:anaerobic dimethyl sulfoxide reductase subunit C